jgi:hypothetical protein
VAAAVSSLARRLPGVSRSPDNTFLLYKLFNKKHFPYSPLPSQQSTYWPSKVYFNSMGSSKYEKTQVLLKKPAGRLYAGFFTGEGKTGFFTENVNFWGSISVTTQL